MASKSKIICKDQAPADVSLWSEALVGAEFLLLHASPVYYGFGIPHGDGSAVVVIPGFLGTDVYLMELYAWLGRIGYRPYFSGIGLNADCPNILIQHRLRETVAKARKETGARVHLIGHSLGGLLARAYACQNPKEIASVITLGAPFRGTVCHTGVLRIVEIVRQNIINEHGRGVLPDCYTGHCTCDFLDSLRCDMPGGVAETAIYTKSDGLVDWHYCITGNEDVDCEAPGTHIGLAFNSTAYSIISTRLAAAREQG